MKMQLRIGGKAYKINLAGKAYTPRIPDPYTLTYTAYPGVENIKVTRTASSHPGASIGDSSLPSNSEIYYDDELEVEATAASGYRLNSDYPTSYKVRDNIAINITAQSTESFLDNQVLRLPSGDELLVTDAHTYWAQGRVSFSSDINFYFIWTDHSGNDLHWGSINYVDAKCLLLNPEYLPDEETFYTSPLDVYKPKPEAEFTTDNPDGYWDQLFTSTNQAQFVKDNCDYIGSIWIQLQDKGDAIDKAIWCVGNREERDSAWQKNTL